jgi:hypothetical protein
MFKCGPPTGSIGIVQVCLEMQILRLHPRHTESDSLEVGLGTCVLSSFLKIPMHTKIQIYCFRDVSNVMLFKPEDMGYGSGFWCRGDAGLLYSFSVSLDN